MAAAATPTILPNPIPDYKPVFEDEYFYDVVPQFFWVREHWYYSIYISFIYLLLAFATQFYMRRRPPFQLRKFIIFWNLFLTLFSGISSWRLTVAAYEFYSRANGLESVVCDNTLFVHHGTVRFWGVMFVYSKVFELIGTYLVIFTKKPLPFFHLYHHVTVLLYVWWSTVDVAANGQAYSPLNLGAHAIMYAVLFAKSLKLHVPKMVDMAITLIQILQMLAGIYLNYVIYSVIARGDPCTVTYENVKWATLMYFSYFVFICHYFAKAYFGRSKLAKKSSSLNNGLKKDE